jgi:hypothetical protein
MARELGLDPTKLGKLDNHRQEPWKAPLPQFIEDLYAKRFSRARPDVVKTIEEIADNARRRRAERAPRIEGHKHDQAVAVHGEPEVRTGPLLARTLLPHDEQHGRS